jgi:oligopeptidase B
VNGSSADDTQAASASTTNVAATDDTQAAASMDIDVLPPQRHLHLPRIADLEAYVLEGSSTDNFLNVLPDIAEAMASYVRTYPEQVASVWQGLKPILKEIRKRNTLHGRHISKPTAPVCAKRPSQWTNSHGDVVHDDYAWLTEKDDPEVMRHLDAENRYIDGDDGVVY